MTFADLNVRYTDLRDGLRAQIGPDSISDVNIRPPSGDADEASFLWLTSWCFGLLFEAGRVSVPFLLGLQFPQLNDRERHNQARDTVQQLRTFQSHNLGFDDGHDLNIRKAVSDWFVQTCKGVYPTNPAQWRACFERLCTDVCGVLSYCTIVLSTISASEEDSKMICEDLRRRLNRNWRPHQFDLLVENAAARLGERINARSFRERRISDWRDYLMSLPEDLDPVPEMERLIDGEVANHFHLSLPIRTQELMETLRLDPGPEVKRALDLARRIFESGVRDPADLLQRVGADFFAPGGGRH